MTPTDTNKLPAEVLMAMARRAVDELSHGNDDFDLIHPDTPRHKDIVCAMQAAYDASPGPGLEAENARLREVVEWYADQFCEFGKHDEGCGKYDDDTCAGCKARTIARAKGE